MARTFSLNTRKENLLTSSFGWVCFNWLCVKVGLGIWAAFIWSQRLMPQTTGYFYHSVIPVLADWQGAILGMWQRWDGIYYQIIAEEMYSSSYLTAFFPVYPMLGRVLAQGTGIPALAALQIISAVATLTSMLLLYRMAHDLFSEEIAKRVIVVFMLFPTAFFLFGIYPQSLALTWILLAYEKARKDHWLTAGLAALLAGMTHATVLPLSLMLAVQAWQTFRKIPQTLWEKRILTGAALFGVVCLPILGASFFLAWRFAMGYPALDIVQASDWGRVVSMPWETLWALVTYFPTHAMQNWLIVFNTFLLILMVGMIVIGWRRLPVELKVYQVTILLFLLSTHSVNDPLTSFNRYVLLAFPLFLTIGSLSMNRFVRLALFGLGTLASLAISGLFLMWKWIG